MALKKEMCINHPDRPAIGVCVMTGKAICAECSTRYEGVNYSKEGLRMLQAQRALEAGSTDAPGMLFTVGMIVLSPLFLFLLYLFYYYSLEALLNIGT
ncbi:MAG: hypothetical protein JW909_09905 [Planctomycetes bacterium]|nr:hypothetical protein [Planctomycetota bacterium]